MFVYYPEMVGEGPPGSKNHTCDCGTQPPGQLLLYLANDYGFGFGGHLQPDPVRSYQALLNSIKAGYDGKAMTDD